MMLVSPTPRSYSNQRFGKDLLFTIIFVTFQGQYNRHVVINFLHIVAQATEYPNKYLPVLEFLRRLNQFRSFTYLIS